LNDKYTSVQREWFTGRRFLYLVALFTEPEIQGRGVGMRFVEEVAHMRADREGLVSYLQGTAVAMPFYVAKGWQPVERFGPDLKTKVK
jgi:GNAT superfamily N-acetyltransferase